MQKINLFYYLLLIFETNLAWKVPSFKLKERDLVSKDMKDIQLFTKQCEYSVVLENKKLEVKEIKDKNEIEVKFDYEITEKIKSKDKTTIKKNSKRRKIKLNKKTQDKGDFTFKSILMKPKIHNMYWLSRKEKEELYKKVIEKASYYIFPENKDNNEKNKIKFNLKNIPCDTNLSIASLTNTSLSTDKNESNFFVSLFTNDRIDLDLVVDLEIDFANKVHLNYSSQDFRKKYCSIDSNPDKFRSNYFKKSLCNTKKITDEKDSSENELVDIDSLIFIN
jgi:hypothetical protein